MRLFTALKKNIGPIIFIGVAAAILIYMTQRKEGFATCNATNCAAKGGSWINNRCYKPCSSLRSGLGPTFVLYQECITPNTGYAYWTHGERPCDGGPIRTINTFCAYKIKPNQNKAQNKITRPTFSSC